MNLSVKEMCNEDIPFIFHVYEQNRNILHGNYISFDEWKKYFANSDTEKTIDPYESHYIIMDDSIPAAWLKINGWDKPEICISMLVVDDAFKHRGIGKFSIQFAEKQAKYWAKSAIRIQTTKDNIIAIEFYLKCGYKIVREMIYKVGDNVDREGYEFKKDILPEVLTEKSLNKVIEKIFGTKILHSNFQSKQLQGGTVGDVRLITGIAESADNIKLPYKIVLKIQKKWERQDDPDSWRREYDFYKSNFGIVFSDSLRWPFCYHAEMNDDKNETQLWMEYIEGISGYDMTVEMIEKAAYEIGRFQGKLYTCQTDFLQKFKNLSKVDDLKKYYLYCHNWKKVTDYIHSKDCEIPLHLREMLIWADDNSYEIWNRIEKLPVVLCHRDFWVTNIFYREGKIVLIDWDTAGWGYMGEDIKQLISDEIEAEYMVEYYKRCVPAYFKGFSEFADVSDISMNCIREMLLLCSGYCLVKAFMESESHDEKKNCLNKLQKIYEMENF